MAEHRRTGSWSASTDYLETALSGLITDVDQAWKSMVKSNTRTKTRFASLHNLQAFQSPRFTDSPKYQTGRNVLACISGQEGKEVEEGRKGHFRRLMGLEPGNETYLTREVISGKEARVVFRNHRRRFGEVSLHFPGSRTPGAHFTEYPPVRPSPRPSKRADINKYVIRRIGKIMKSNSISKEALLVRSASQANQVKSGQSSPVSPVSPGKKEKRVRFSDSLSRKNSCIQLIPSMTLFPQ